VEQVHGKFAKLQELRAADWVIEVSFFFNKYDRRNKGQNFLYGSVSDADPHSVGSWIRISIPKE
jgi:hypothetical protein